MWYYAKGQERVGPVTLEELRARVARGEVQPMDLVWTDGMADWMPASARPELGASAMGGVAVGQPMPVGAPLNYGGYAASGQPGAVEYGGFWVRFCAAFIDGLVVMVPNCLIGGFERAIGPAGRDAALGVMLFGTLARVAIGWLYFAFMESSEKQATLGKMAMGLIVTDELGNRISFARATGRHFGKFLSSLILGIGYIMQAFTQRRQALHDMLAGTLVVTKRSY
ncbi:MAG TPA: RDD family protein [Tepidisphaeraceae bacterium]|jgi:uncharacterized RDD family membrane protein YckC